MISPLTRSNLLIALFAGFASLVLVVTLALPLVTQANPPTPPTPGYINKLPPVKQTMEMMGWARSATAAAGTPGPTVPPPPPVVFSGPTPTLVIDEPHRLAGAGILIPSGSYSQGNAPSAGARYFTTDTWVATLNGIQFVVEVGAMHLDVDGSYLPRPWQGIVSVRSDNPKLSGFFLTPVKAGTVSIVDADGTRLKLVAEKGTSFTFDVSTLKFVSP